MQHHRETWKKVRSYAKWTIALGMTAVVIGISACITLVVIDKARIAVVFTALTLISAICLSVGIVLYRTARAHLTT
mgnify:CR=1 FL=1